jgi:hypothetical protein
VSAITWPSALHSNLAQGVLEAGMQCDSNVHVAGGSNRLYHTFVRKLTHCTSNWAWPRSFLLTVQCPCVWSARRISSWLMHTHSVILTSCEKGSIQVLVLGGAGGHDPSMQLLSALATCPCFHKPMRHPFLNTSTSHDLEAVEHKRTSQDCGSL